MISLMLSLEIAEADVDLHEFKDGIIIHGNIQTIQFLLIKYPHLKFDDFNKSEIMLYDQKIYTRTHKVIPKIIRTDTVKNTIVSY